VIKSSKESYSSLESKKILSHNIGLLDRVMYNQNNCKTYPSHDPVDPNLNLNCNFFIILNYKPSQVFGGFEQLFRSICCPVIAGQTLP